MTGLAWQVSPKRSFRAVLTEADGSWTHDLAEWLNPYGVEVLWAKSGPDVLEIVEDGEVHLAVMDANAPRLDGLSVLGMMRRANIRVPAVLVSGSTEPDFLARALRLDAFSVVRKPVDRDLLSNTVSRIFRRFYGVNWGKEPVHENQASG